MKSALGGGDGDPPAGAWIHPLRGIDRRAAVSGVPGNTGGLPARPARHQTTGHASGNSAAAILRARDPGLKRSLPGFRNIPPARC